MFRYRRYSTTTRSVVGLVHIAKALYPDRFTDIDQETVRQEYNREFHVENYTDKWIYPSSEPVNTTSAGTGK